MIILPSTYYRNLLRTGGHATISNYTAFVKAVLRCAGIRILVGVWDSKLAYSGGILCPGR